MASLYPNDLENFHFYSFGSDENKIIRDNSDFVFHTSQKEGRKFYDLIVFFNLNFVFKISSS